MAPRRHRILGIVGDTALQELVTRALDSRTFDVICVFSASAGIALLQQEEPELILLDLLLVGGDGVELCRRIREHSLVPLVALTALGGDWDKVKALDQGADDYLAVPFNPEELLARVRALLRRSRWGERQPQRGRIHLGLLEINLENHHVTRDGRDVPLSPKEWALLAVLIRHANRVLPHRMLLQEVWGENYVGEDAYLHIYIKRLRNKLEENPRKPRYLLTEHRVGYVFSTRDPDYVSGDALADPLPVAEGVPPPSMLPSRTTSFVGREAEVERLLTTLRRPDVRLITLTGPGGTGKTRLALEVGAMVRGEFPDGVYFVDLAPLSDPGLVVTTIVQSLHIREAGDDPLALLKERLATRRLLLLLDNFEHLVGAAPLIADLLGSVRGLKVLVTSRVVLRLGGEHEFAVPPLVLPDLQQLPPLDVLRTSPAVALFVERAATAKQDFVLTEENAAAIAEICARLDGLPLAIELAAARIKVLSPQTMVARLSSRLALLTGGPRDVPDRQRTLRDTLDWSYELLDEPERLLFARMSVFAGGCTLEAAEAVCDFDGLLPVAVLDLLGSLLDKSMLRAEGGDESLRFLMLQVIREYAQERLAEREEAQILRRHAEYYLTLVEQTEPWSQSPRHQQRWLLLEQERDNVRAALQWSLSQSDGELALRFAGALWKFWHVHSRPGEGAGWLERVLAHPGVPRSSRLATVLYGAGWMAFNLGDRELAMRRFDASLQLAQALGDRLAYAEALHGFGEVIELQGDYLRARILFEESLTLSRELGHITTAGWALSHLGGVLAALGDYQRAREAFEESRALFQRQGHGVGIAFAYENLGLNALQCGELEQALVLLQHGLALHRELGNQIGAAMALNRLAEVAFYQGQLEQAEALLQEALDLSAELGYKRCTALCLNLLACVLAEQGQLEQAIRMLRESWRLQQALKERRHLVALLETSALLIARRGDAALAAQLCGAAAATREADQTPLPPIARPAQAALREQLRAALGETAFAAAWAEGQARTVEQALALALA